MRIVQNQPNQFEEYLLKYDFDWARAYEDFFYFAEKLYKYHGDYLYPFGEFHKEMIKTVLENRYSLIVVPVGHLKSRFFSIAYPCWRAWRETNYEIALVSSSGQQTAINLEFVKYYLENTPWLQHLVPKNKTSAWNSETLMTTNRVKIAAKPFNSSSRGMQPHEIIYDDLLRDVEGRTDMSMDVIKDTFWGVFFGRGQTKFSRHIMIGTPQSEDDLYHEIRDEKTIEKGGSWKIKWFAAVKTDSEGDWVEPLWKERFSLKELKTIQSNIGLYRFNREYMTQPAASSGSFFPFELLAKATDDNLSFSPEIKGTCYIGVDYAMSTSPTGDYNVFTVVDSISFEF